MGVRPEHRAQQPLHRVQRGNVLQVVFVALLVGGAAYALAERAGAFVSFNRAAFDIIQKVLSWIIWLAPIGVLGLLGNAFASYGNEFFAPGRSR